jgi:hypothetical protein
MKVERRQHAPAEEPNSPPFVDKQDFPFHPTVSVSFG